VVLRSVFKSQISWNENPREIKVCGRLRGTDSE
jgi:hypothetical protein